ncbi:MAG: hypothetical protein PHV32_04980 [Eubacteriales bacterium]|nr:hypothetical protein [Eubacteriales bacterium]
MSEEVVKAAGKFDFKMDRYEKGVSLLSMVIFFLSFTGKGTLLWTIVLMVFTVLVFIYYFTWYRKKPAYVLIENERIFIHNPPFYKPCEFEKQQIENVSVTEKKIKIKYKAQNDIKSVTIYSQILSSGDFKKISGLLKMHE